MLTLLNFCLCLWAISIGMTRPLTGRDILLLIVIAFWLVSYTLAEAKNYGILQ